MPDETADSPRKGERITLPPPWAVLRFSTWVGVGAYEIRVQLGKPCLKAVMLPGGLSWFRFAGCVRRALLFRASINVLADIDGSNHLK